jgi:hypothetical protein
MSSATEDLYVVEVDTRAFGSSAAINGYQERRCNPDYFQNSIVNHPKMICWQSQIATSCGLDIKLYFVKHKTGLATLYCQGGEAAVGQAFSNPSLIVNNNGAATFLTTDIATGLCEHMVCGKAYVVQDNGRAALSRGQVWGLQEMINCAMDIYDMDPENMAKGKRELERWAKQYRKQQYLPPSGAGGVDIYSPRSS